MLGRAGYIAAVGMGEMQKKVDILAGNISNAGNHGFKEFVANFADLGYQNEKRMGTPAAEAGANVLPAGVQIGLGTQLRAVTKNFSQGTPVSAPGSALNLAIDGKGLLMVELPNGENAYTRAGNLTLNGEGELVDLAGNRVAPGIVVPNEATDITISKGGVVTVKMPGVVEPETLGTLTAVNFINTSGLEAIGDNLYLETPASGEPVIGEFGDDGFGSILQRYLESSNVDSITSLVDLVNAQRNFEMLSKVTKANDSMSGTLTQMQA